MTALSLTDGSVRKGLFSLWLPMIGGILAVKAVGLADAYFVGQLGEEPLAAISFTFPVVMTLISLAIGLSAGASSVLSRAIGNGAGSAHQRAIVAGAIAIAVGTSLVLSIAGFFSIGKLLELMGATGGVLQNATWYMQIWFAGAVFMMLPIAINGLLRSTGDGVSPALLMSAIAVLNIALNPLLIYGFGPVPALGMQGAATATVIARLVSTFVSFWLLSRKNLLELSPSVIRDGCSHWREIVLIGLPASLSTSLNPIALS
ncbi:MAG: MATE family efflux transporter, partial [Woeseiaceae bacterium]|nr:MATE family efflux transporter [Woeseiaceae bacterium]